MTRRENLRMLCSLWINQLASKFTKFGLISRSGFAKQQGSNLSSQFRICHVDISYNLELWCLILGVWVLLVQDVSNTRFMLLDWCLKHHVMYLIDEVHYINKKQPNNLNQFFMENTILPLLCSLTRHFSCILACPDL